MARGRRARDVDTTPGKILVLGLVANLPVFVGFVLMPLLTGGDRTAGLRAVPYVLFGTPLVAAFGLVLYVRAPAERRQHAASRLGLMLGLVGLLLWGLVLAMVLLRPGA